MRIRWTGEVALRRQLPTPAPVVEARRSASRRHHVSQAAASAGQVVPNRAERRRAARGKAVRR